MVANIRGYTPNYGFKLINFDTPRWHTHEYANWNQLDSMFLQLGTPPVRGEWLNSTLYVIGDRTFDAQTGDLYRCLVQHTSAATGTFADDRTANPTYWTLQLLGVPLFRGPWTPLTVFALGDIVVVDDYAYYLCTTSHTSSTTFPPDAAFWQTIFDATNIVLSVDAAAESAADAAQSAAEAAASAAEASQAASAATSAQSAFRWDFDASTVVADPGVGKSRFNSAIPTSITRLILSANSADFGNPNVSPWVITWDDSTNLTSRGSIYIRNTASPENYMVLDVNGPVIDHGTWQEVSVIHISHGGVVAPDDHLAIAFTRTGNSGTSGSGSGDMQSANNLSDVADPLAAAENIGVGVTDTPTFAQVHVGTPTVDDHATTKLYVDTANTAQNTTINAKADKTYVDSQDATIVAGYQAADTTLQTNINAKADTTYVNTQNATQDTAIALKADKTYVDAADALKAPLASPAFTGNPTAPTPSQGDNDTSIATTAFVTAAVPSAATAAEYISNAAPTKMLTPGAVWTAAAAVVALTDAASVAPDFSLGLDFSWNIPSGTRTLANPTSWKVGQKGLIRLINSGGTITSYGAMYKFPGGVKPTSVVGQIDIISYVVISSGDVYCTFSAGFA